MRRPVRMMCERNGFAEHYRGGPAGLGVAAGLGAGVLAQPVTLGSHGRLVTTGGPHGTLHLVLQVPVAAVRTDKAKKSQLRKGNTCQCGINDLCFWSLTTSSRPSCRNTSGYLRPQQRAKPAVPADGSKVTDLGVQEGNKGGAAERAGGVQVGVVRCPARHDLLVVNQRVAATTKRAAGHQHLDTRREGLRLTDGTSPVAAAFLNTLHLPLFPPPPDWRPRTGVEDTQDSAHPSSRGRFLQTASSEKTGSRLVTESLLTPARSKNKEHFNTGMCADDAHEPTQTSINSSKQLQAHITHLRATI